MRSSEQVEDGRIDGVERELRRVKRAMVATLVCVAAAVSLTAATREPGRIVEIEKLVLRDRQGKARATLSIEDSDGTATLAFLDEAGRTRLRIGSRPDGSAGLTLRDEAGGDRLTISATAAGETAFALQDGRGTPRLGFALSPEGPGFRLYDAKGGRRVVLGVASRGVLFQLEDRDGKARTSLGLSEKDDPRLVFIDAAGKEVASLP